jgi:hypothetical protein
MSNHIFLRFSFLLLVDDFGNIRLSGANGEDILLSPTFSFCQPSSHTGKASYQR